MNHNLFAVALVFLARGLAAESVELYVQSDNSELSGEGISSTHEGAGVNYFFLGSGSQDLSFNGTALTSDDIGYTQFFSVFAGYAQLTVGGTNETYSFSDDGVLEVDGSENGFYACKNTNDPYHYSETSYELMYGTEAPNDSCSAIKLVRSGSSTSGSASGSASGSSTISASPKSSKGINTTGTTLSQVSTGTQATPCHTCTVSTAEGAANAVKPADIAAIAFGLAAMLI